MGSEREPTYEELEAEVERLRGEVATLRGRAALEPRPFVVPPELHELFEHAREQVGRYFDEIHLDPGNGTIEVGEERYVLVRAAALSFNTLDALRDLYADRDPDEALSIARNLLFDIAHIIGLNDARAFHARLGLEQPLERLAAGPVHFSHTGWALVEILPDSRPTADEDYYLVYNHPFSFEADAWLRAEQRPDFPVCIMNAGYSSGWCEESFGMPLTAVEISCRARGDETCTFIMAPPHRIEEHLARYHARVSPTHPVSYDIPTYFDRRTARHLHEALMQSQKLEAIGTLAGGVAHDLNNILAVILGLASALEVRLSPEDAMAHDLGAIAAACRKGRELTSNLLGFAHRDARARRKLSVNRLVREVIALLQRTIAKGITIETDLESELGVIEGEPGQLNLLLVNLALNAAHAMGDGGRLTIRTSNVTLGREALAGRPELVPGPYVRLEMTDTGAGMSRDVQARAFEPFFTTKPRGEGTGLGLTMVQSAVKGHGGRVTVESGPGRGTRVTVDLPALEPGRARVDTTPPRGIRNLKHEGSGTVLLVEDEAMMRASGMRMLETLGYQVLVAEHGQVAVELFRSHHKDIDIVILDLIMPTMDGPETFHRLKQLDPQVRILLTSGYARAGQLDPLILGAAGFLQKPYDIDQLADKLTEALA